MVFVLPYAGFNKDLSFITGVSQSILTAFLDKLALASFHRKRLTISSNESAVREK